MIQVHEDRQRILHDVVGFRPLHVHHKSDAARVVFKLRIVESLLLGQSLILRCSLCLRKSLILHFVVVSLQRAVGVHVSKNLLTHEREGLRAAVTGSVF